MRNTHDLFAPATVGGLKLKNRFVMSPMQRSSAPNGVVGALNAAYYRRRAEGGIGLIIAEGAFIDHPAGSSSELHPRFYGEDALAGWGLVADEVHRVNGKVIAQLWHVGPMRKLADRPNPGQVPVSASGLRFPDERIGEALSQAEIVRIVDAYAAAADHAKRLGFDGIEIHSAHGYLLDNFIWNATNKRTDNYGGDWRGRTRLVTDVIRQCRLRVGPEFPIIVRFSEWKLGAYDARPFEAPGDLEEFLSLLNDAGADIYDVSTRRYWEGARFDGGGAPLSQWVRKLSGKPTIIVGSVGLARPLDISKTGMLDNAPTADLASDLTRLQSLFEQGAFDLAAVGRALIAEPNWVNKVQAQQFDQILPFSPEMIRTSYYNSSSTKPLF